MARPCRKLIRSLAAVLAAGLFLLSGCSDSSAPEEYVPQVQLAADLTYSRELLGPDGEKLAVYSAALPQLQEQTGTEAAHINDFYKNEMTVHEADCESWFGIVSQKNYPDTRTNSFAYRLLDAPAGFLSVERAMTVNGVVSHYFTEFFSLVSGWQRTFADLYSNTVKCETLIRDRVEAWCTERQIPCDKLAELSFGQLTAEFLPDGDLLRLYYDHQTLSDLQDEAVVVELPLAELEDFRLY